MGTRGRKSESELSIVPPLDAVRESQGNRVQPPDYLSSEAKKVFRDIVQNRPKHWFSPCDVALLSEYCAISIQCRLQGVKLTELLAKKGAPPPEYFRLQTAYDRQHKTMLRLAEKMRITQNSTIRRSSSRRMLEDASGGGVQDTERGGVVKVWDRGRVDAA